MAISIVARVGESVLVSPVVISKPTGTVDGDVMVALILSVSAAPTTVPTGWTQLQQNSIGTPTYLTSYRKVASSEPGNYTWGISSSNSMAAVIVTYRGVDNTTPVQTSSAVANAASTAMNGTAITTSVANEMVIWGGGVVGGTRPVTVTPPSAMTKEMQQQNGVFVDFAVCVGDAILAAAGTTGSTYNNGTQTSSTANLVHLVALNPAATHPITSNVKSKFGATSGNSFGSVRRTGAEISLGAGDFTVEGWVYWSNNGSTQVLFDWGGSGAGTTPQIKMDTAGHVLWVSAGATQITSSNVVSPNTWTHVAVVRSAGVITIYIGGVSGGTFASVVTYTTTTQFAIGKDYLAGSGDFGGYLDEARVSVSAAFYAANFTPPTSAFPDSLAASASGYIDQLNNSKIIVH